MAISSNFSCTSCVFLRNNNTVLLGLQASVFNIKNSSFSYANSSLSSVLVVSDNNLNFPSVFENCTFQNNTSIQEGIIKSQSCSVILRNSRLEDNVSGGTSSSAIISYWSNITIENTKFYSQSLTYIYAVMNSYVLIINSEFSNSGKNIDCSKFYQSDVEKNLAVLANNSIKFLGGVLYARDSVVFIGYSNFSCNYAFAGASIYCLTTNLNIEISAMSEILNI